MFAQTVFTRSDGTETYYFNSQLFSKFMYAIISIPLKFLPDLMVYLHRRPCKERTSGAVAYVI